MSEELPNPYESNPYEQGTSWAPASLPAWEQAAPESPPAHPDWWARLSGSWIPELAGAGLALLTLAAGSAVAFSEHAETQQAFAVGGLPNPDHGYLDITGQNAPGSDGGAVVTWVDPDGASAGVLRSGDVIAALDHTHVSSFLQLRNTLSTMSAGTEVNLTVERNGITLPVEVRLELPPGFNPSP